MDETQNLHSGKRKARPKLELKTEQQTYDYALNLLSFRDHSQKEMKQKLTRKGASPEQAQSSIDKLTDYGIMNEERFAQRVYEAWLAKRIYGRQHLAAELVKKGVPKEYCQQILEQFTDEMELERAEQAAQQYCKLNRIKISKVLASNDNKERQRLYAAACRYLIARGFGSSTMEIMLNCMRRLTLQEID